MKKPWRTLAGREALIQRYKTEEECREAGERIAREIDDTVLLEMHEDGRWWMFGKAGEGVSYPDWKAPQDIVLGDFVETNAHGHCGRVYKVHPSWPADHGCPESDAWMAGQQPESMTPYRYERWISVLVHNGGSVVVPSALAHRVDPFPFDNDYANQYFRQEVTA